MLDLTPFGFTPTESQAYASLLKLGPSSGYAVARALSIARANAYQALDALVTKGAAVRIDDGQPRRYRAVQPRTLFTAVAAGHARQLDDLERQLTAQPDEGASPFIVLDGDRAVTDAAIRAVVRSDGPVRVLGTPERVRGLTPALRAREAAGKATSVYVAGDPPPDLPSATEPVDGALFAEHFGQDALLVLADGVLIARFEEAGGCDGFWSEAQVVRALASLALDRISAG